MLLYYANMNQSNPSGEDLWVEAGDDVNSSSKPNLEPYSPFRYLQMNYQQNGKQTNKQTKNMRVDK